MTKTDQNRSQKSDARLQPVTALEIPESALRPTESGHFELSLKGLSLGIGQYRLDMSNQPPLPRAKRPLAALLPESIDGARFEIGEVQIQDGTALLTLFGPLEFNATHLIF